MKRQKHIFVWVICGLVLVAPIRQIKTAKLMEL